MSLAHSKCERAAHQSTVRFIPAMMLSDPPAPPLLRLPPAGAPGDEAPEVTEADRKDLGATVTVRLLSLEGASCTLSCSRYATLRSLQKQLCSAFGKNYPFIAAAVCVGKDAFSDFEHVPFRSAVDDQAVSVVFTRQLTDPSGYDDIGRKRGYKVTLEHECAWEQARARGETTLDLEEWLSPLKRLK